MQLNGTRAVDLGPFRAPRALLPASGLRVDYRAAVTAATVTLHQGNSGSDEVWVVEGDTMCSAFKGFEGGN